MNPPGSDTAAGWPLVSFVIPVRNDAARLAHCLESIAATDYPRDRVEVVVIDNGSSDGSGDIARTAGAAVIELPRLHLGELRNRGVATARGDIIAFVDADHEIDRAWVKSAAETLREPTIAMTGTLCHAPDNGTWVQQAYALLRGRMAGIRDVEWLGSGNMAVRRDAFEATGGFTTTLETCEDVDLCQRLRQAGYRIVSDDRLRNIHFGDPATLGALFRGELWRGRDNLRASLRGPLSLRSLPSIVIPILELGMIGLALAGILAAPVGGLLVAGIAVGIVMAVVLLRTLRIARTGRLASLAQVAQVFLVAATYDMGRALALVTRVGHRARLASSPSSAHRA